MAATSSGKAAVTLPSDEEILITREFDAPRRLVFRAWTTPELVRRWWSGHRGEMQVVEIDLRVGGTWRYVMVATGGYEVAFHGEFREVVPDERIVTTEVYEGAPEQGEPPLNVVSFGDTPGGGTLLELLVKAPDKAVRDIIIESGMETGMQEQMDVLEALARPPLRDELGRRVRVPHEMPRRVELARDQDLRVGRERHLRGPASPHCHLLPPSA